jgi:F-type H+-transporting ATPase subunit delta
MIDPVTSRWAEALFNLARRRGALDAVRGDVARLARELGAGGRLASLFDERLALATRRRRAGEELAGMHQLTQAFVSLVLDKRRVEVLRHLGAAFHRRDLAERGAAEGVVESARALDQAELARLGAALGPRLGKELTLRNRVVPELIGGLRVLVESKMIDASVAGRLEGMKKHLLAAALPRSAG